MAIAKVILNGVTQMDVTDDTVTASTLSTGIQATAKNGTKVTGTHADISTAPLSVTQNGTYTAPTGTAYTPVTVNVSGGGGPSTDAAVRFIDYDGTEIASYTSAEWSNVTALPANPTHTGLTSQGWNWTLAQINAQLTAYPNQMITVGQMYITDDGKTRIYVHMEEGRLQPYLGVAPNGTVVVDWGDNSPTETLTGTSLTIVKNTSQHTYASAGDYVITLNCTSGSFALYGSNSTNYSTNLLKKTFSMAAYTSQVYANMIKKVELGSNVSIGSAAFLRCYSLENITIPSGVTSIGSYAFQYCYSLENITIPSGVTSIGNYAFQYCYGLENITIPSGVTSIGSYAFQYCYSLENITIPSGVTSIGNYAFQTCEGLTSITIASGITSIGSSTFSGCHNLTSITIPASVTSIGSNVFQNCYGLESITIPSGVTSIGNYAFDNCCNLVSVTIPSGVTSIGSYTFRNCYNLVSVTLPSTVTSIDTYTFQYCHSLDNITIPADTTLIGQYAFGYCGSLIRITIPSSVTTISSEAFQNCYGMAEYHLLPTTPPTLGSTTAFGNIQDDCIIYVPAASLTDYQNATNWSTYASRMVGE